MSEDGEDGMLYDAGDSGRLTQLLAKVARHPGLKRKLAKNARKKAVERFDLQRIIDDIELFLEEVLIWRRAWRRSGMLCG